MFFERAKVGLNEAWRYVLGAFLIFAAWIGASTIVQVFIVIYVRLKGGVVSTNIGAMASSASLDKNFLLCLLLLSFVFACLGVFLVVKYLHKKPFMSLVTSRKKFSWRQAGFGFALWMIIGLVSFYIGYQNSPEDYTFSFDLAKFLPLLLISLFILPFQTGFEELLMRGYLTQGVGLVTRSRLLALFLPAIVFGLLHSFNPEVLEHGFWKMMPFYIGMGLFLGVLTLMNDGMEISLGVHFANNFMAAVLLNMENSALPTDALFMVKNYNPTDEILYSLMGMLLFLLITAWIYKWKDFGKLVRKIN